MATNSLSVVESFRDILTCSVCLQLMEEPRTLSCLHSFCTKCILHHIETKTAAKESTVCPLCGPDTPQITAETVHQTKVNFNYKSMIEGLQSAEPQHTCSQCDEGVEDNQAVSKCSSCGYLCTHCVEGHKRYRALSQHTIEYLYPQELVLSSDNKCSSHSGENLTLYCTTHDKIICHTCVVLEHPRDECSVSYIDEKTVLAECKSLIMELDTLEKSKETLANHKELLQARKEQLKTTYAETKSEIEKRIQLKARQLEDESTHLTQALDTWYAPLMKECAHQYDSVSEQIDDITSTMASCHTLCTRPPTVATLINKVQLTKKIQHLQVIEPLPESDISSVKILDDGAGVNIKEIVLRTVTTLPTQGEELEVAMDTDTGGEIPGNASITATVNGKKAPVFRRDEGGHCYLKWIPQKHVVQQVQVDIGHSVKGTLAIPVKRSYTPITPLAGELVLSTPPLGVCLVRDDTLAITSSSKTIKLVDSSTFEERGDVNGGFVRPYFMATCKDHLWVTDREAHNVKRISLDNYTVDITYGNKGAGHCQLAHPRGIAVTNDDRVYVADMRNNRIVVLRVNNDNTVTQVTTIGSDRLNQPSGITINHRGELAVCDDRNCKVVLFSSTGKHLQDMGVGKSGHGLLCSPIGITVDQYDRYIVGEFGSHCITCISPEGTILSSTRTVGGVVKEFTYPRGVAIDNSGYIYVADHGNKRIVKL